MGRNGGTLMWKGRFQEQTAELLQTFSESISFDWRLWRHDIEGSIAHSAALVKAGLLTAEEREQIVAGLREIGAEIESGKFQFKIELEDIHMNIESELTRRIGAAGAKLTLRVRATTRSQRISGSISGMNATRSRRVCGIFSAHSSSWRSASKTSSSPATRISSGRSRFLSRTICSPMSRCLIATTAA